jgi:hypothetical protein
MAVTQSPAASLAEYLASLAVGGSCPCCGGTLSAGSTARAADALVCASCGCEVEAEDWPFRAAMCEGLVRAA